MTQYTPTVPEDIASHAAFRNVDVDGSNSVEWGELRTALNAMPQSVAQRIHFSGALCRLLIRAFATPNSQRVRIFEFKLLYNKINLWQSKFLAASAGAVTIPMAKLMELVDPDIAAFPLELRAIFYSSAMEESEGVDMITFFRLMAEITALERLVAMTASNNALLPIDPVTGNVVIQPLMLAYAAYFMRA